MAAIAVEVWVGTYLKRGVSAFFADYVFVELTPAKMEQVIADPDTRVWVSTNTDGIDGFIVVADGRVAPVDGCPEVEIDTFYVQPRHHGKGIGSKLLQMALGHCRTAGAASVWLTTNAENDPAIGFYLAKGFAHVGETEFVIADQGYLNNVYRYDLT